MIQNKTVIALLVAIASHLSVFFVLPEFFPRESLPDIPAEQIMTIDFTVAQEEPPSASAEEVPPPEAQPPEPEPEPEPQKPVEPAPVVEPPKPKPRPKPKPPAPRPRQSSGPSNAAAAGTPSPGVAPPTSGSRANAVVLRRIRPAYPALSLRRGEEGRVVLRVMVKTDGSAGDVGVRDSSGFPRLDAAAVAAVRRWKFEPHRINGAPVDHEYSIVVKFSLLDN